MNAPRKGSGGKAVLWIIGIGFLSLVCCGVGSAIAIPGFIGYTRRSKTAEVESNLRSIFEGTASYYQQERFGPAGMALPSLPPPAPRTPPAPGCDKQIGNFSDPAWLALGFTPSDPLYYSYEFQPGPDGRTFVIRALGDLDCDGAYSTFELHGGAMADGTLTREPALRITDELE